MTNSAMIPIYTMLWFNCILIPMAMIPDEVHDENDVIDAMTAETAEQADDRGMKSSLKPYFNSCQADAGITPGVKEGVTYDMANNVITCMEDKAANASPKPAI